MILFVLRRAIVGAFLQHGEYTPAAADNTSRALAGFAIGLIGFSIYLFALRGFYAHQDTRTPFVINVVRVRAQHRAGVRPRRLATTSSGSGSPSPSPTSSVRSSALQVLSYKVPGFPLRGVLGNLWPMVVAGAAGGRGDVAGRHERRRRRRRRGAAPADCRCARRHRRVRRGPARPACARGDGDRQSDPALGRPAHGGPKLRPCSSSSRSGGSTSRRS